MSFSVSYNQPPSRQIPFRGEDSSAPANNFGAAVASYFLPGAGQFINGDKKRGMVHLGALMALSLSTSILFYKNIVAVLEKDGKLRGSGEVANSFATEDGLKKNYKNFMKDMTTSKKIAGVAILVGVYANTISSVINAFKGSPQKTID